jgi:hypothetical protein
MEVGLGVIPCFSFQAPESMFEDFRCGFCHERFEEYEDLTLHQNDHIQAYRERRHTAPSTSTRPRRQRREMKNKPLPCPLCPLDFVSGLDELQQHFTCHVLGKFWKGGYYSAICLCKFLHTCIIPRLPDPTCITAL